uniref:Uncharacterized protein n=1 Tax=Picea glauca TaxID=3330 RepID=A0A117NGM9_PICGL|nr:hypothetical protein ABT39_MTgene6006 [Picea glauca]
MNWELNESRNAQNRQNQILETKVPPSTPFRIPNK